MPVVFHTAHALTGPYGLVDDPGLPRIERLLNACPDTIFCAHGPSFWAEMGANPNPAELGGYPKGPITAPGRVAALLAKYPNLYGDLSAGSGYNALTRTPEYGIRFLERFQERLLFATDILNYEMEGAKVPILGLFRDLLWRGLISEKAHQRITRENAQRLLRLA